MSADETDPRRLRVIAPCLGTRYSGVTASLAAVLPEQAKRIAIAALGFHLPPTLPRIGIAPFLRHCRVGPRRIWHARRNVEMVAGLLLRRAGYPLALLFTSAAQRRHTRFTRFLYHRMDAVVATSAKAAAFLDREAVVVPHGVDTDVFHPPQDRAAAWAARALPGRHGIGILGRIRPQKGLAEFVDAMVRVLPARPDWTAVIIGETTPEQARFEHHLRARIRAEGLLDRIRFVGFLPRIEDVPDWYRALSVVVCASRVEGFGLTCLEAMASGCPVIATRAGAWPEIVTDGTDGFVVPTHDPAALAEAVAAITEDPLRAAEMGRRARQKVLERYRIANEADALQAVYRMLLADAAPRS